MIHYMARPLFSPMSSKQQHPLKRCALPTLRVKRFADQKKMNAANSEYGYKRQMLAARRQKKNSSSKRTGTQGTILSDNQGLNQVRPQPQDGQTQAAIKEIDELADIISRTESTRMNNVVHRTADEQMTSLRFPP